MYIEKVLDLWVQLMKNGGKNKSVAFIILVSVLTYNFTLFILFIYLFIYLLSSYNQNLVLVFATRCCIMSDARFMIHLVWIIVSSDLENNKE